MLRRTVFCRRVRKTQEDIAGNIVDDGMFGKAWTKGVIWRRDGDHRKIFASIAAAVEGGPETGFTSPGRQAQLLIFTRRQPLLTKLRSLACEDAYFICLLVTA